MHIWYLQFGTKIWTLSQNGIIQINSEWLIQSEKGLLYLVLDLIYCEIVTTKSVTGETAEPTCFLNRSMCWWLADKSRGGHWAFMHCLKNLFGESCGHGHYTALQAAHGDWWTGRGPGTYSIPEDSPSCFLCMCFSTTYVSILNELLQLLHYELVAFLRPFLAPGFNYFPVSHAYHELMQLCPAQEDCRVKQLLVMGGMKLL